MTIKDPNGKQLREHLLYLLNGGGAHARFDDVVKNMPEELRGAKPNGLPHTAWLSGTFSSSAATPNTRLPSGPRDIGRRRKVHRARPHGTEVFNNSARI